VAHALARVAFTVDRLSEITRRSDPWFLDQMAQIVEADAELGAFGGGPTPADRGHVALGEGGSASATAGWARLWGTNRGRGARRRARPRASDITYKTVDNLLRGVRGVDARTTTGTYEDTSEVAPLTKALRS